MFVTFLIPFYLISEKKSTIDSWIFFAFLTTDEVNFWIFEEMLETKSCILLNTDTSWFLFLWACLFLRASNLGECLLGLSPGGFELKSLCLMSWSYSEFRGYSLQLFFNGCSSYISSTFAVVCAVGYIPCLLIFCCWKAFSLADMPKKGSEFYSCYYKFPDPNVEDMNDFFFWVCFVNCWGC